MPTAADKVVDEALELPADARIGLVDRTLASLNLPTRPDIDRLWAEEAERRVAEIDRGEVDLIPGEEVFDRIRRKHAQWDSTSTLGRTTNSIKPCSTTRTASPASGLSSRRKFTLQSDASASTSVLISASFSLMAFAGLCAMTNEWRQVLAQVRVRNIDLRDASLTDAIRPINQAIVESVTNGTPPVITVDLSPPKVTFTNCTACSTWERHFDELVARWKQKNADMTQPIVPRPVTFMARDVSAAEAIHIITQYSGGPWLHDRAGKPVVGDVPDMLLACRAYPWSESLAKEWEIKAGIEGADHLEDLFGSSGLTWPKRYTMLLVPETNVVLLLGEESWQRRIGGYIRALTGSGVDTNQPSRE